MIAADAGAALPARGAASGFEIASVGPASRKVSGRVIGVALAGALFFASYLSFRPAEILFTVSDGLYCVGLAALLAAHRLPLQPMRDLTPAWLISLVCLLAGLLIGSVVYGDPVRWVILAVQYSFSFIVLPMLLIGHAERRGDLLMKALVAGIVCMEAFGASVYILYADTSPSELRLGQDFISGSKRLGAFLGDGNWNAAAICMAMPFVFYLRTRQRIGRLTAAVALAVLGGGLLLTASVSGLISATAASVLFVIVAGIRPPIKPLLAVAAAGAIAIALFGLPKAFETRVAPALTSGDVSQAGTFDGRVLLMEQAWAMLEDTQLIGYGADQFRQRSPDGAPVHHLYLLLWTEGGLLSLLGWLGLMAVLIIAVLRARRYDPLAAALGAAVLSTFLFYTSANPHMYARFWITPLLLAMGPVFAAVAPLRQRSPTTANSASKTPDGTTATAGVRHRSGRGGAAR